MLRELDARTGPDLRVTLYWQEDDNILMAGVEDLKNPERELALIGIPSPTSRTRCKRPG
ncbi:MAG TPA: hypothetical protein VMU39_02735 [Solirubrobacteraceae bacterium]|nr:hypothetical protein [Solirubrobacteraceae bacterium]